MIQEFENDQVWLSNIPKSESIEFVGLLVKYKKLLKIQWLLFFALSFLVIAIVYFKFDKLDLLWFVLVLIIWFTFFLIKFALIHLGFPYKGYAIRQKDLHYKTGYLTHRLISVPFNRIQHVEIRQGFISKILNLAILKIYTAGNSTYDLSIKGISLHTAEEIKRIVTLKVNRNV